jgi:hypothetical protein
LLQVDLIPPYQRHDDVEVPYLDALLYICVQYFSFLVCENVASQFSNAFAISPITQQYKLLGIIVTKVAALKSGYGDRSCGDNNPHATLLETFNQDGFVCDLRCLFPTEQPSCKTRFRKPALMETKLDLKRAIMQCRASTFPKTAIS